MKKKEVPKVVVQAETIPPVKENQVLGEDYEKMLNLDPKYSLQVDPTNIYYLSDEQKSFIQVYSQIKDLEETCDIIGIDTDLGKRYLNSFAAQQELRRIAMAQVHRQFACRMATLDEIGGYLTSLIIDYNVPKKDRLKNYEKIKAAKLLVDINNLKQNIIANPTLANNVIDVESEVKDFDIKSIKKLIEATKNEKVMQQKITDKETIINELNKDNSLTPEDINYLNTLSVDTLMKMVEEINNDNDLKGDNYEQN